ncbi:hypothetical protein F511_21649 [Dorcoceras hygrometricum]|uniref:Uncharacterized protein n=1 Tax=Dorcoceras hygrometricum TaxID=472368 RepID=A0A2Z7CZM1_9LAMI|nr:hypothetical protein F511_21649 [Dorcoceras hygrometricum]
MASCTHYPHQNSSPRGLAMVLALASAIILSPLYVNRRRSESRYEERWGSSGFLLPVVVVAGLIVAIKTTTTSSKQRKEADFSHRNANAGLVFRIGSSLGLAGILIMLLFVISWQASVKHFFWR